MDKFAKELHRQCMAAPGRRLKFSKIDPAWTGGIDRQSAERRLLELKEALGEAQERLYASCTWSLLLIFQAMDAAGKDSTIKHVLSGINPQGCAVTSFKKPSSEELAHDFLWRCTKALPERGQIGVFNRSYYEEVLVVKVHPELLDAQRLPGKTHGEQLWQARYESINCFERHLAVNGTKILKFFLHVSREEQRRRLLARLEDSEKHWKFCSGDLNERALWDDYMRVYEDMLRETSTGPAPWYIIPADHKWATRTIVAQILFDVIASLNLEYPQVPAKQKKALREARRMLEAGK